MASAGVKEIRRLKEEEQTLSGSQSVPSLGVVSEGEDVTYSAEVRFLSLRGWAPARGEGG